MAARNTDDVVVAVNFARRNNLRLVVKGGGHSYQGTSNAPDSLLVWTRKMNNITVQDAFVGTGCEGHAAPVRAVTAGAGALWAHVYDAVTTKAGGSTDRFAVEFNAVWHLRIRLDRGLSTAGRRVACHDHDAAWRWTTRASISFDLAHAGFRTRAANSSRCCCAGGVCCTSSCDTCRRPPDVNRQCSGWQSLFLSCHARLAVP
ncbi:FAD-binding protein [Paraburkholderia sp. WSM4175]|uniref:FAD-binding protein n=1 Tax=Paraburkholderia sp. WSM4175 TaxID=2991072 RepID=UPI003D1B95C4